MELTFRDYKHADEAASKLSVAVFLLREDSIPSSETSCIIFG
jgi:hypothetical protein